MRLAFVVAVLILVSLGCHQTSAARTSGVLAAHEVELDACIAKAKTHAEYEACADTVDARYGIPREKDGGAP